MAFAENAAWYRKYRPSTMADYLGDDIKAMVKARFTVPENRPSVIMISGDRGCGKTTFARIISKYYLCESQVNGEPCEQCEICQTINEVLIGGAVDVEVPGVTEIDATTANGKDAIQSIIEDAIIEPIYTRKKVLILDECHMITAQGQNSLLKVIEDIPEHLCVIFCTTNPEKVLGTIQSRCQLKLTVRKKSVEEMASRLLYIAEKEGITTSKEALSIIAKKADRVPRECINLFESIAKNYGNVVTVDNVRASTGDVAAEIYMSYFKAANTGLEAILNFIDELKKKDMDARKFMSGLTRFVLDSLYIRHAINIEDYTVDFVKRVKEIFNMYKSSEFDAMLQVIESASRALDEDENKNELTLITTAMRIGKIGLIAKGLATEYLKAEKENKQSITEYRQSVQNEIKEQIINSKSTSVTKEAFSSIVKTLKDVANASNIQIVSTEEERKAESDVFASFDELSRLMDG